MRILHSKNGSACCAGCTTSGGWSALQSMPVRFARWQAGSGCGVTHSFGGRFGSSLPRPSASAIVSGSVQAAAAAAAAAFCCLLLSAAAVVFAALGFRPRVCLRVTGERPGIVRGADDTFCCAAATFAWLRACRLDWLVSRVRSAECTAVRLASVLTCGCGFSW